MRVMIWFPNDSHAVWDLPGVPRVGERVETADGVEYEVRDLLWTLETEIPALDANVTVFLR